MIEAVKYTYVAYGMGRTDNLSNIVETREWWIMADKEPAGEVI